MTEAQERAEKFEAAVILRQLTNLFPSDDGADYDAADFKDKSADTLDIVRQARGWLNRNYPDD